MLYTWPMIKSFLHKGFQTFFVTGSKAGIQAVHAKRLRLQLALLDSAKIAKDMDLPGWRMHLLKHAITKIERLKHAASFTR